MNIDPNWHTYSGPLCTVCGTQVEGEHWFQPNPPQGQRYHFCAKHWAEGVLWVAGDHDRYGRLMVGDRTVAFLPAR